MAVRTWSDRDAMIDEVNASRYGLTANILTDDLDVALDTARRVDTGVVWVNGRGQHYITTPFGGHKDSGLGVEGSLASLESFTTTKSIHILPRPGR
jgi:betaine-aldehyde dehydrogenase